MRLNKEQIRNKIEGSVTYEVILHPEHTSVRGNVCASGDDVYDEECENQIIEQLERGEAWSWCTVEVKAEWKGLSESNFLGCCSYGCEADFREDGYFHDMKNDALSDLCSYLADLKHMFDSLSGEPSHT